MGKAKQIFTNWRVITLLVFLVFALIAIQPHVFGNDGVTIRSVLLDSSSAQAGINSPDARSSPLSKEKIVSIDGNKIATVEDYFNEVRKLKFNTTATIETNEGTYTILTDNVDEQGTVDIGLRVSQAPTSNLKKGLDLEGGTRVLLKPSQKISADDLELTIDSLRERLNVYGLSDIVVRAASDLQGEDFILIEIAGVTEEEIKELLAKQGKFEAKIGNETVFFGGKNDITYVCRSADCSGINPQVGCQQSGDGHLCGFFFGISLSPEAAKRHADITGKLTTVTEGGQCFLSEPLLLFLDDIEVDSLRIQCSLKGREASDIQITGSGVGRSEEEAISIALDNMKRMQTVIVTGSLPVKLEVVKMDTISPALGKEFLYNMLLVGALAILAVILVVSLRYRKLKVISPMVLTLVAELLLILGFAAVIGWNLDLAAIAGIIVVVGTGVDHLIIITDETLSGETSGSNWKRRLKNAMFIVLGAYFTTFAGMLPLLWAGAGLLKGFALITLAGVSFGVLLARPAFAAVIEILSSDE